LRVEILFTAVSLSCQTVADPDVLVGTPQKSGISVRLQAVSAIENGVVWVSGLEDVWPLARFGGIVAA
jgi:hypothetical protein